MCRRRGTALPDGQVQVFQGRSAPHAGETREGSIGEKMLGVIHIDS